MQVFAVMNAVHGVGADVPGPQAVLHSLPIRAAFLAADRAAKEQSQDADDRGTARPEDYKYEDGVLLRTSYN